MKSILESIIIFCDGACSGNPGPGGWGAIIATPEGHVRELGGREETSTNNKMELTAAIRSLEFVRGNPEPVFLHTDSKYVIQGITGWIYGWMKRGWKSTEGKPVANRDLWEALLKVTSARPKESAVTWRYIPGHAGIAGNDRADSIAVDFSKKIRPTLYDGPLLRYSIPIHDIPDETVKPTSSKSKSNHKVSAFSYLSLIGDIAYRHATWRECENRVKGRSGAKFKKALSADDENKILEAWGMDPASVRK